MNQPDPARLDVLFGPGGAQSIVDSQKAIDYAKIYTERLPSTGSSCETRYSGLNKEAVERYAQERYEAVDRMRSPSLSCFGKAKALGKNPPIPDDFDGFWFVDLKYYGLD